MQPELELTDYDVAVQQISLYTMFIDIVLIVYMFFTKILLLKRLMREDGKKREAQGGMMIIIITMMSCRQHGYPWLSLVTSPNHSSPLASLQGYILYPHIAAVCMFELVILILLGQRSISFISSSLLPQQCLTCLVCLAWIVFVIGGRWPYRWCLVGCCRQDLFNIARNILV